MSTIKNCETCNWEHLEPWAYPCVSCYDKTIATCWEPKVVTPLTPTEETTDDH